MKKIFWLLGLVLSFQIGNSQDLPSAETLSNDGTFIRLLTINSQMIGKISNTSNIKTLVNDGPNLQEEQYNTLWQSMGYENAEEFNEFVSEQVELILILQERYPQLQNSEPSAVSTLISEVLELHPEIINLVAEGSYSTSDYCTRRWRNCRANASAVYSGEILACTGAAIGVGSLTAGIGGILFQLGCGATALYHLSTMREGCDLDLENCNE